MTDYAAALLKLTTLHSAANFITVKRRSIEIDRSGPEIVRKRSCRNSILPIFNLYNRIEIFIYNLKVLTNLSMDNLILLGTKK